MAKSPSCCLFQQLEQDHSQEAHITAQVRQQCQQAGGNVLDQAGPTRQIEVREIHWEASRWRHPLLGRRYDKEGTSPQGVNLHRTELLQRSSKGTDVPPHTLHGFQCMGERLHKRVLPRMQLHIFPPTTTETSINSLLEVTTSTREGENGLKTGTWENHECNKVRSNYELNYSNNGGISPKEWHSCWVYGPYSFNLPTKGRPTQASNREINQNLLTLFGQPSCLTAFRGNWRTGCSHGFLCTASQSEDVV